MRVFQVAGLVALIALPAAADIDPCLVGTWTAVNADVEDAFEDAAGGGTATVAGTMMMTISPDGKLAMRPEDLTLDFEAPGSPLMSISFAGESVSSIVTKGNRYATGGLTQTMESVATIGGQSMPLPAPPQGYRTTGLFVCNDTGLALSPDGPPDGAPRLWRRVP
jgi:hypothetical protein